MRIAIDISAIVYGTGVSVYTKNLVEKLLQIDKKNEYFLYGGSLRRRSELKQFVDSLQGIKGRELKSKLTLIPPTLAHFVWNKLHSLPIEVIIGPTDVFHSSDWTEPPSGSFKVTTVHDLTPIVYPEWTDPGIVSVHKAKLKWVVKESKRVIVPSFATAADVLKLGIKEDRIRVIPEAVDSSFRKEGKNRISEVKKKYGISGSYIISVGVNKRKNTERIISAYSKLKSRVIDNLVIVGTKHGDINTPRGVIFTGHALQSDMPALYSGAESLVYPSLYEGFGLPILEAFACRTPVVTSNLGSLKEIGENAAVLVDPKSVKNIAEGVETAINNCEKLAELGQQVLRKYSWEKTAAATLKVYNEAA